MADNKNPSNGDLASKKQQLIDKLLNKFAKDISLINQIPLPEALEIAKKTYKKSIEQLVGQMLSSKDNQIKAIESALENEQETDEITQKVKESIQTPATEDPVKEIAEIQASQTTESKTIEQSDNLNLQKTTAGKSNTSSGGSINSENKSNSNLNSGKKPNQEQSLVKNDNQAGNANIQNSDEVSNSQPTTTSSPLPNPNQQDPQVANQDNQNPADTTQNPNPANENSSPLNQIAQNESQLAQNPENKQANTNTLPENTEFKEPDKVPQAPGDSQTNIPPGNNTSIPLPKSKQNTKPGNGNLKPGNKNTKPGDTTNSKPNIIPPNPNLEKYKNRGAGRIGGAAPGGFIRSGQNYTGNRFKKDAEPITIQRIQKTADTGFSRAENVQKQAVENIQKGNVDKGERQLKVAKSIQQKASRLAANSRFRLALEALKKQLIKAAIPIIVNALIAAIFVGGFVIFTVAVLCALDRTPVIQKFLPKELQGFCGGKTDNAGANCPAGYTAWIQDPTGKWVQTANNTTTGNGSTDRGTGIGDIICLAAPRIGDLADPYLRAFMRGLGEAENGGSYEVSNGCVGKYQFCGGGIYASVSGKPDGLGGTFPSDPTQMSPAQQDRAFITAWEADYSFRAGPSIAELKNILRTSGIQAALDRSSQGTPATASDGVTRFGMCGTWTPLCSSNIDDVQGKQTLIKGVYDKVLAEELAGKCGNGTTSNNANQDKSLQTLATVTNNLKQFFQPVRAEAQAGIGIGENRQTNIQAQRTRLASLFENGNIYSQDSRDVSYIRSGAYVDNLVLLMLKIYDSGYTFATGTNNGPARGYGQHGAGIAMDFFAFAKRNGQDIKMTYSTDENDTVGGIRLYKLWRTSASSENLQILTEVAKILNSSGVVKVSIGPDLLKANGSVILGNSDEPGHDDHFHYAVSNGTFNNSGVTPGTTTSISGPVICCPPGVTPSGTAITNSSETTGTLSNAKDSGNEFSQLSKGHLEFMQTIAKERGYTGPFADNGGPNAEAKTAADKIIAKARSEGIQLLVAGETGNYGYRGYNAQTDIFLSQIPTNLRYQDSMGTPDKVPQNVKNAYLDRAQSSAPVGYSEHHTGKGMDFIIEGMTQDDLSERYDRNVANWLATNAPKEGFKLSYPAGSTAGAGYEPWHWFYTGQRTSNIEVKNNKFDLSKLFSPIKAEAQNTNGIERAQIIVLHITAGGNGTPEADIGQLAFVQNPPGCSKPNCKSYNELILSDGQIEKLQTQGGNVVGTGAGWVYDIDPTTWKAGNARITGPSGSGVINSISYQISYPLSKLKGEEGDRLTSSQVKATAQTLTEFAKAGGRAENIFTHASLDPRERSEDRPFINFDGSVNGQLVEMVSLVRANGQWKTGNYANISDQELATIITMINVENAIAASEKSGDSALPAGDLNKLKASAEKLREQLKNKTFQINQAGTSGACIQAGSGNSGSGATTTPGNLASNGGQTLNSGTYDVDFLKKLADGILPIFSSERDCYRVVAGSGSVLEKLDPDMIFNGLVPSGQTARAYQFHDFMQQSQGGVPNYIRFGYEYSTDTAKAQRGSLVVLSRAINGDSGDINVFIGKSEMASLGRSGDGWMGRPVDNESLSKDILGIYTKIKK